MLSDEGIKNLELLKQSASTIWNKNIQFINEKIINIPVDSFEIEMIIYKTNKVILEYEMGMFALKVLKNTSFKYLDELTENKIIYGFESMLPENILHNFKILDETLKHMNQ